MPAGNEVEFSASEEWTQKPSLQDGEGDSIQRHQKPAGTVQVCDEDVSSHQLSFLLQLLYVRSPTASRQGQKDQDGCSRRHSSKDEGEGSPQGLLHWRDMPPHLQFNPYVLGGYRPLLSFWGSLGSLFYIHNETINILTHGIPILYILLTVPQMLPWERLDSWFLPWCHVVGAVSPWVGSFTYHLFMNTRCGEPVYRRLLQLDMLGIWISQSFGAMPMVSASVYCLPWSWRSTLLSAYSILSLWGLYKALTAWSPWERRLCFALPFCMRAFLCCLRSSGMGGGDPAAMMHVILQDAVSAIGGAIGAMHVPEKWMPGRVDFILNSHNIMHLLVVSAVYCMHHATVRDLLWMASPSPCASRAAQIAASLSKAASEHLTAGAGEAIAHAASEL